LTSYDDLDPATAPAYRLLSLHQSREDFATGDTYSAAQVRAELEQRRHLVAQ
jgi:hypothetical protein